MPPRTTKQRRQIAGYKRVLGMIKRLLADPATTAGDRVDLELAAVTATDALRRLQGGS